jgi:hypothetical protein
MAAEAEGTAVHVVKRRRRISIREDRWAARLRLAYEAIEGYETGIQKQNADYGEHE